MQIAIIEMRRPKEISEQTRTEILFFGLKVFNEKGYMRTRLEDIAAAAGVTRGAIYHHFGSKAKLFTEIIQSKVNELVAVFKNVIAESDDPLTSMKSALSELLVRIEEDTVLNSAAELLGKTEFTGELKDLKAKRDDSSKKEYQILLQAIKKCEEQGLIKNGINLNTFTFTLFGALDGVFRLWLQNPELISLKESADQIIEYLFTGVEAA